MLFKILSFAVLVSSCSSVQMISGTSFLANQKNTTTEPLAEKEIDELILQEESLVKHSPREEEVEVDEASPEEVALEVPDTDKPEKTKFNPFRLFSSEKNEDLVIPQDKGPMLEISYHDEHFQVWKKYFLERGRERFARHLGRGEEYRELIQKVFDEYGLPKELFYVGLIESGYVSHAKSHASAVGPWQFIKGTATRYGMKVTPQFDERINIHKSTEAAAKYFRDLYNIFGSWELALSAYNAGEYRIINAIRKGNTRDYKELVRRKLLPTETIHYVPKVAAARYLAQSRGKYQIDVKPYKDDFFITATPVTVNGSFSLSDVSQKLGLKLADLKKLNPDLRRDTITAPRAGFSIVVPNHKLAEATGLSFSRRAVAQAVATSETPDTGTYIVRRGDNLSRIAGRHRTTISELKSLNAIRGSRILVGQRLRVPASAVRTYRVRRGDNLYHIAKKFKTTINEIVTLNSLKRTSIFPNQELQIPAES